MKLLIIALFFYIFGKTSLHAVRNRSSNFRYPPIVTTNSYPSYLDYYNVCRYNEFQCDSLQCIPEENQCDGILDCGDRSDEIRCETIPCNTPYLFQCNYGACISRKNVCDGKIDCRDNSDEVASLCNVLRPRPQPRPPSVCGIQQFPCDSMQCIPEEDQCDGKRDCLDGSDETENCVIIPCNTRYLFQCIYGACISRKLVCDGKADCQDSSDESPSACNSLTSTTQSYPAGIVQCGQQQFRCSSNQCLDDQFICDGKADCSDKSDETASLCGALICPRFTFRCNYGACVQLNAICNGHADCADGSDEDFCPTNPPTTTIVPPVSRLCPIPNNPGNGSYSITGQTVTRNAQNFAEPLSILIVNCDQGFNSDPPETFYSICRDGVWDPNLPICSQTCSLLNLPNNSNVRCESGSKLLQTCDNAVHGVRAIVKCVMSSNNTSAPENCVFVCSYGNWQLVTNFQISNEFSLNSNKTLSFNITVYPD